MDIRIWKQQGVADELITSVERTEIDSILLSMPHCSVLNGQYGIARHPVPAWWNDSDDRKNRPHTYDPRWNEEAWREEDRKGEDYVRDGWYKLARGLRPYKPAPEEHLKALGLMDAEDKLVRRVLVVGNRNLGNNWHVVAWHREWEIASFALAGELLDTETYTCLVWRQATRSLTIEELGFSSKSTVPDDVIWATYGQQVLRDGKIRNIQDMIEEFYDLRHVFCLNHTIPYQAQRMNEIWDSYPKGYREKMLDALNSGVPRGRYLHNCVALSDEKIFLIQKHGTPEEVAHFARAAGARDAVLLDNGGSVFLYAWFALREMRGRDRIWGNYINCSGDWRSPSISTLVFVLHGPVEYREPPGAVSFHIA